MVENHAGRQNGKKSIKRRRRMSFVQHVKMIADRLNGV